ncbi:MAG: 4-alpha-glucanotransferase [Alphaproteobacteria bacterium]
MNSNIIIQLADIFGVELRATEQEKFTMLQKMEILPPQGNMSDAEYDNILNQTLKNKLDSDYLAVMKPVTVTRENRQNQIELSIPVNRTNESINWRIEQEDGKVMEGSSPISEMQPVLKYGQPQTHEVNGVVYQKFAFEKPQGVDVGYHNITIATPDGRQQKSNLFHCPQQCYVPPVIENGGKIWGMPVQAYQLRSPSDQGGGGDFSSIDEMAHNIGTQGGALIGLPPMHAMFSERPEDASPYAPSSREFFNYLYSDVTAIPEFNNSKRVQDIYDSPEFTTQRRRLQRRMWVDYADVKDLKQQILNECFEEFKNNELGKGTERDKEYQKFCSQWNDKDDGSLYNFATFQALSEYFCSKEWTDKGNPKLEYMSDWPEAYQDMHTKEVEQFKKTHADRIDFYKYTQFEADRQLANVKETCKKSGMTVGVYTDIAVGSSPTGFEAWARKDDYMKASAGAAPDGLSITGQNWHLMGFKPHKLVEKSYSQFVGMLRANMKHAGCARLDHVLQLSRLYMIPDGSQNRGGTFVYYPTDDLMSLVALESHRNKTMFIGEDIGQCPDGFREKMADYGIHRYGVLWFEREWGFQNGDFSPQANRIKDPSEFPTISACALSTHDTPPAEGQNTGEYVWQKDAWGCYENDQQRQLEINQYKTFRAAINDALERTGCYAQVGGQRAERSFEEPFDINKQKHIQAEVAYLAKSNSNIVLIPPSDVTGITAQHNIPGTGETQSFLDPENMNNSEYKKDYEREDSGPNWRRKEVFKTHELNNIELFNECAKILRDSGRGNPEAALDYEYKRPGRNEHLATQNSNENKKAFFETARYYEQRGEESIRAMYGQEYQDNLKKLNDGMKNQTEEKRRKIEEWKKLSLQQQQQPQQAKRPVVNATVKQALMGRSPR